MGKISDIWVRLGLKKGEFDRGMDDVEQRTENTQSVFGKLKSVGVAVWAAIGASVVKLGKDIASSSNEMEDKWEMFTTKAKVAWQTFVRTLVSGDWSNFWSNYKKEVQAATYLQEVLQADTEIMNSINIQKAQMADQLAELDIAMRDQTKSYKERAEAAQKYLDMVTPIYDKEIERAKKLKGAQYQAFFGNTHDDFLKESTQAWLDLLMIEYGSLEPILNGRTFNEVIARAINPEDYATPYAKNAVQHSADIRAITDEFLALGPLMAEKFNKQFADKKYHITGDVANAYITHAFVQYERNRNSEEVQALNDAIVGLEEAFAARNQETKKVQTLLNTVNASLAEENKILDVAFEDIEEDLSEPINIELAPVEIDASAADAELDAWLDNWRAKMNEAQKIADMQMDAITQVLSDGTSAMVDALMNMDQANPSAVLGAIVAPFADLMTKLGEMLIAEGLAVEAAKTSLNSLQGAPAIAAGVALIATAAAIKGGIQKLGQVGGESASVVSSAGGSGVQNIQSEMTIYVEGKLSGSDIVLSGSKTLKNWNR